MDDDAIFEMMRTGAGLKSKTGWDQSDDDDEDAEDNTMCKVTGTKRRGATVVRLDDGRIHVCMGISCPHVQQSTDLEKSYSCKLSGLLVASHVESSHDSSWTGRSCASADPDMNSGAVPQSVWRNKRNAFAASAAAYSNASKINVDDVCAPPHITSKSTSKHTDVDEEKPIKRGAPNVLDVDEEKLAEQKRTKAIKRVKSLAKNEVQQRLFADAHNIVSKLFSVVAHSTTQQSQAAVAKQALRQDAAVSGAAATMEADPRLENYDFVLNIAIRRYVARCKAEPGCQVSISGIHDVMLASNQFVKKQRTDAAKKRNVVDSRSICMNGQIQELCARMIVTMWSALCTTKYFCEQQTGDSFRPFASGIMYSLKRGLRLPNNMVLVPAIESLANQLPTLRSSTATATARQLQQSSHRGLCAIQRGIASIDKMPAEEQREVIAKLKLTSGIAMKLASFVEKMLPPKA